MAFGPTNSKGVIACSTFPRSLAELNKLCPFHVLGDRQKPAFFMPWIIRIAY